MNLFIASRWGNPFDDDGPDGADTNIFVRAPDMRTAATLVDEHFKRIPSECEGMSPVANFAQCMRQVGEDPIAETASVIHGPWIEPMLLHVSSYPEWHRDNPKGDWIEMSEH